MALLVSDLQWAATQSNYGATQPRSELAEHLRPWAMGALNKFALRLSLATCQLTSFPDDGAIVKGTTDVGVTRGVHGRLTGA